MDILFVDNPTLRNILNNTISNPSESDLLYKKKIYVLSENEDENAYANLASGILAESQKLSVLYLIISTHCNLACKYCFVENNPLSENVEELMSETTARTAIDKFIAELEKRDALKDGQIILYGGEPFTNINTLSYAVRYVKRKCPQIRVSMVSNGTLLSAEYLSLLKENNVGIGISIDGPKCINDANRIFKSGTGSVYDSVTSNLKLLKDMGIDVNLSITLTEDVLNNQNEVLEWIQKLGVKHIFWNLYHFSEPTENWEAYYRKMTDFIFKSYDILENNGFKCDKINELFSAFLSKTFRVQGCAAIGLNQLTVQPNGDICVCQGDSRSSKNVIGNINIDSYSDVLNKLKNSDWVKIYTILREKCKSCDALFVCGGGCPLQSDALFGDRSSIDFASCIFYKGFLNWALKKYYQEYLIESSNQMS